MLPGFKWGVVDLTATTVDEYVKALALEAEEYTANADEGEYVATTGVTDADRFSLALLSAAHHGITMDEEIESYLSARWVVIHVSGHGVAYATWYDTKDHAWDDYQKMAEEIDPTTEDD